MTHPDALSQVFAALADPTRRAILANLSTAEQTVTDVAAPFAMTMGAISKHLAALERAGLISRGRNAQFRPCRLEAEPLRQIEHWLAAYRRFYADTFDRLDTYLAELDAKETPDE